MELNRKQLAKELIELIDPEELVDLCYDSEQWVEIVDRALQLLEIRHNGKVSLHDAR